MAKSNYPHGFEDGVLIRNQPKADALPGKVFWVGNNSTLLKGEKGASDTTSSGTFLRPFATIDYAVGQCTANRGDVIYVRPNHTETITAADAIDIDVAGVSVIGLGNGTNRPRLDYTNAAGEIAIGADNVLIENINFHANVTAVSIAVDIEDGVDYAVIRNCLFDVETTGTDEFNTCISLTNNNTGCLTENNEIDMGLGGAIRAIMLDADTDRLVIRNNVIQGDYSTACINGDTTASTDLLIENNLLINGSSNNLNTEPVIELLTATSGVIRNNDVVCNVATPDAAIVADTCIQMNNVYSETVDGAAELIDQTDKGIGSYIYVSKSLTSSAILTTGVDVTGTSSNGALQMVGLHIMTDGTGLAAGTLLTLETDNTNGIAVFASEAVADLGANKTESIGDGTNMLDAGSFLPVVESGKKIVAKCTGTNCTGCGTATIHMIFRRLANGAIIAAA